ncbi:hypothetical protein [Bradyrhizobium sp. RDI18]|uniref:hypothetical protein n=1 Tax=Bradyrhizobium sp. RDI18 TaxID=3367400 RepID=UPI0037154152
MERFSHVNLDLIYGLRGQTRDSWIFSLGRALDYEPQTLSLYPVVVRRMTNIMTSKAHNPELFFSEAEKYEVYDQNVALMASKGYRQNPSRVLPRSLAAEPTGRRPRISRERPC